MQAVNETDDVFLAFIVVQQIMTGKEKLLLN
jgi:hypothetical protein